MVLAIRDVAQLDEHTAHERRLACIDMAHHHETDLALAILLLLLQLVQDVLASIGKLGRRRHV